MMCTYNIDNQIPVIVVALHRQVYWEELRRSTNHEQDPSGVLYRLKVKPSGRNCSVSPQKHPEGSVYEPASIVSLVLLCAAQCHLGNKPTTQMIDIVKARLY